MAASSSAAWCSKSLDALDLAADAAALLSAAEVALLVQRQLSSKPDILQQATAISNMVPRAVPAQAMTWLNCLDRHLLTILATEARMLVKQPSGGWTHWLDSTATPRCMLEAFALAALRFHLDDSDAQFGVEWWVQVRDMDESMPLHWDCDEERFDRTGEHAAPFLATVTYLSMSGGAPTIVMPVSTDGHGCPVVEPRAGSFGDGDGEGGDGDGAYASFPIAGKHLAFDGRLLHGTQHEGAQWSTARTAAYVDALDLLSTPRRVTLLVNVWTAHRPTAVRPLAAETAHALRKSHTSTSNVDGELVALAAGAFATAKPAPAERIGDDTSTGVRELPIGRFHDHAPIGMRHLDAHLSRPPAPHVHFVRVAEARALLHPTSPPISPPPSPPSSPPPWPRHFAPPSPSPSPPPSPAALSMPTEELILDGRFAIERSSRLGVGGFSDGVYRGRITQTGEACAVKISDDHVRNEREIRTLQALSTTPYVQRLLGYSQDDDGHPAQWPPDSGVYYIVQELGSSSLAAFLSDAPSALGGKWPVEDAASICTDILRALACLHQIGFAHMDVKPANLVRSARTGAWSLIDMDSCRPLRSVMNGLERWELTDRYTPPELACRLLNDATALARLGAAASEEEQVRVAKEVLREQEAGDVVITEALDLWTAGATIAEVVSLTPGYKLHSPYFDEIYDGQFQKAVDDADGRPAGPHLNGDFEGDFEREEAGGPRDNFFHYWLEERSGALTLPETLDGAMPLLTSLLSLDPVQRGGRSAAALVRDEAFLHQHAQTGRSAKDSTGKVRPPTGRWFGLTGCTCDGCGRPCLDVRHACLECDSFDYCTPCYLTCRQAHQADHQGHQFEASRDVSVYEWFESDAAAEVAWTKAEAAGAGGVATQEGGMTSAARQWVRAVWRRLRQMRRTRRAPSRPKEVSL